MVERPRFWDWFACPDCDERHDLSSLAYEAEIVLECYTCGLVAEYVIGEDISLEGLDVEAIQQTADQTGDTST